MGHGRCLQQQKRRVRGLSSDRHLRVIVCQLPSVLSTRQPKAKMKGGRETNRIFDIVSSRRPPCGQRRRRSGLRVAWSILTACIGEKTKWTGREVCCCPCSSSVNPSASISFFLKKKRTTHPDFNAVGESVQPNTQDTIGNMKIVVLVLDHLALPIPSFQALLQTRMVVVAVKTPVTSWAYFAWIKPSLLFPDVSCVGTTSLSLAVTCVRRCSNLSIAIATNTKYADKQLSFSSVYCVQPSLQACVSVEHNWSPTISSIANISEDYLNRFSVDIQETSVEGLLISALASGHVLKNVFQPVFSVRVITEAGRLGGAGGGTAAGTAGGTAAANVHYNYDDPSEMEKYYDDVYTGHHGENCFGDSDFEQFCQDFCSDDSSAAALFDNAAETTAETTAEPISIPDLVTLLSKYCTTSSVSPPPLPRYTVTCTMTREVMILRTMKRLCTEWARYENNK